MPAWNEGGRDECYERLEITMSYEELWHQLSVESRKLIEDAGFVLVPKSWRDRVLLGPGSSLP
jgi:hypothetical protein